MGQYHHSIEDAVLLICIMSEWEQDDETMREIDFARQTLEELRSAN